jgi:hypothetical protein
LFSANGEQLRVRKTIRARLAHVDRCARQVSVDQAAHAELGCRQRVKRLLCSQFTHKSERSPDVVGGDVVFTLYVLERHAADQASVQSLKLRFWSNNSFHAVVRTPRSRSAA